MWSDSGVTMWSDNKHGINRSFCLRSFGLFLALFVC